MKIAVIPIDNRPVCYNLVKLISDIDGGLKLFMPERKLLGGLASLADYDAIISWLDNSTEDLDAIVVSLDTIAYGGLVASRRSSEKFEQIQKRINHFFDILKNKKAKIYAFSSIMRISNNNYNEEEKEYWSEFGTKIFEYSYQTHKLGGESELKNQIPQEILEDYLATRERNFEVNKLYLKFFEEGLFETLVYSKDDCAEFGFNVKEANYFKNKGAVVKTGADEIPLTLITRAYMGGKSLKVKPVFIENDMKNLISRYEDISVENSVRGQLELAGCSVVDRNEDLTLIVNNFKKQQGEIVMDFSTEAFEGEFGLPNSPYMIADVRFANGADKNFVNEILKNRLDDKNFYGYSAWNTTANTLGSLICGAVVKFFASEYREDAFKKLQAVRLLDDWAYQDNVRKLVKKKNNFDIDLLKNNMLIYEDVIKKCLSYNFSNIGYS